MKGVLIETRIPEALSKSSLKTDHCFTEPSSIMPHAPLNRVIMLGERCYISTKPDVESWSNQLLNPIDDGLSLLLAEVEASMDRARGKRNIVAVATTSFKPHVILKTGMRYSIS